MATTSFVDYEATIHGIKNSKKSLSALFTYYLLLGGLLHEGVQSGLFAGSGVLLDDLLLSCFVEGFDGLLECLLGFIDVAGSDSFTGLFDGALYDTVRDLVTNRVLGGHAHVLLGGFLDWHTFEQ